MSGLQAKAQLEPATRFYKYTRLGYPLGTREPKKVWTMASIKSFAATGNRTTDL